MRNLVVFFIRIYQKTLSLDHGFLGKLFPNTRSCRFVPSCSDYTAQAVSKYGSIKGLWMGSQRLSRCNPWNHDDPYDPVK
jgi:uncharacterized protein